MIKVLIVNDTVTLQQHLKRIIAADPECELIGIANDGIEGMEMASVKNPDVILMDIHMPRCDGMEATRRIMRSNPTPLIIVTATITKHMPHIYDCMANGALEVVRTPVNVVEGNNLVNRIKIANTFKSQITKPDIPLIVEHPHLRKTRFHNVSRARPAHKIIVIGASTGGPNAIAEVIKHLPEDLNAGLIIVQHIDADFIPSLAEWFDMNSALTIQPALHHDSIGNGIGFVAARNENLLVTSDHRVTYEKASDEAIYAPSIDVTFHSIAKVYGANAIGVLLTGMGNDGAAGLKAIRDAGGHTIAQDESSSLIYGMPRVAAEMNAAEFVLPVKKIAKQIMALL